MRQDPGVLDGRRSAVVRVRPDGAHGFPVHGGRNAQAAAVGSTTRQRIEGFKVADTLADVHFEFDRYDLTAEATQALDANAAG